MRIADAAGSDDRLSCGHGRGALSGAGRSARGCAYRTALDLIGSGPIEVILVLAGEFLPRVLETSVLTSPIGKIEARPRS